MSNNTVVRQRGDNRNRIRVGGKFQNERRQWTSEEHITLMCLWWQDKKNAAINRVLGRSGRAGDTEPYAILRNAEGKLKRLVESGVEPTGRSNFTWGRHEICALVSWFEKHRQNIPLRWMAFIMGRDTEELREKLDEIFRKPFLLNPCEKETYDAIDKGKIVVKNIKPGDEIMKEVSLKEHLLSLAEVVVSHTCDKSIKRITLDYFEAVLEDSTEEVARKWLMGDIQQKLKRGELREVFDWLLKQKVNQ